MTIRSLVATAVTFKPTPLQRHGFNAVKWEKNVFSYRLCFSFSLSPLSLSLPSWNLPDWFAMSPTSSWSNCQTSHRIGFTIGFTVGFTMFYHIFTFTYIYIPVSLLPVCYCSPSARFSPAAIHGRDRRGRSGADCDVPCTNAPQPEAPGPHNLRAVTPEKCSLAAMGSSYFPERKTCPHEPEKKTQIHCHSVHGLDTHTHSLHIYI